MKKVKKEKTRMKSKSKKAKTSPAREFSAGGIVAKKEKDQVFVLIIQHSGHLGWGFPKGHIEAGETVQQAALREVQEETGIKGEIIKKVGDISYMYNKDGKKIAKKVTFYLMRYVAGDIVNHNWEVSALIWVPVSQVEERLSFAGERRLWAKVSPHVRKYRL